MSRINKTAIDVIIAMVNTNAQKAKLTKACQADIDAIVEALIIANNKMLELRGIKQPRRSFRRMLMAGLLEAKRLDLQAVCN